MSAPPRAGSTFVDAAALAELTGHEPRRDYSGRTSGWPNADEVIVAPATLNTVGKLAGAIADCWALSMLTKAVGYGIPIVMAPHTNPALYQPRSIRGDRSHQLTG